MLTSSRVYIRKKSTLVLYKLYLQYPQVGQRQSPALPSSGAHC